MCCFTTHGSLNKPSTCGSVHFRQTAARTRRGELQCAIFAPAALLSYRAAGERKTRLKISTERRDIRGISMDTGLGEVNGERAG